jgi:acyl-coenzyme A thioesterase PaaI-like protein
MVAVTLKRNQHKVERQQDLVNQLQENPFLTDESLAEVLSVSVPTVRLDRLELGIPELRVRTKDVAEQFYGQIRSLGTGELIGDILELEVGKKGISVLEVKKDMVFSRTKILRGHYLFAQVNSLAVALIDADVVLTGSASVRYLTPVFFKDRVVARAEVAGQKGKSYTIRVKSMVGMAEVLRGRFTVVAREMKEL